MEIIMKIVLITIMEPNARVVHQQCTGPAVHMFWTQWKSIVAALVHWCLGNCIAQEYKQRGTSNRQHARGYSIQSKLLVLFILIISLMDFTARSNGRDFKIMNILRAFHESFQCPITPICIHQNYKNTSFFFPFVCAIKKNMPQLDWRAFFFHSERKCDTESEVYLINMLSFLAVIVIASLYWKDCNIWDYQLRLYKPGKHLF